MIRDFVLAGVGGQGVISLGALGTALLTRMADRRGRRRVLLAGLVLAIGLSLSSGLVRGLEIYAALQVLLLAAAGSVQIGSYVAVTEEVTETARPVGQSWWGLTGALGGGIAFLMAPALYIPGYERQRYPSRTKHVEIVHGWDDEIIPADHSIRYAREADCTLHLISGDHALNGVIDVVANLFENFLSANLAPRD